MNKPQTSLGLNDRALQQLQTLMQVNLDCRDGLLRAVTLANCSELKALAEESANRHDQQAAALKSILRSNFDDTNIDGTVAVAVQRIWMGIRSSFPECETAFVDEAIKMQIFVRDHYVTALGQIRGRAIRQLLNEHVQAADLAHHQLSAMKKQKGNHGEQ